MNKKNVAKIYSAQGDLTKRWFVSTMENGKRKKIYGDINTFPCFDSRMKAAQAIVDEIGGVKKLPNILREIGGCLLGRNVCMKTVSGHQSKMKRFQDFFELRKLETFTLDNAKDFCKWLKSEGLHDTTINHYIGTFRGCFRELIDEGKLNCKNPFANVTGYKADYTPARYYTKGQITELMAEIKEDYQLYMFVGFVYYCFIRPKELRYLHVSDIILEEKRIRIPAIAAKNKKTLWRGPFLRHDARRQSARQSGTRQSLPAR